MRRVRYESPKDLLLAAALLGVIAAVGLYKAVGVAYVLSAVAALGAIILAIRWLYFARLRPAAFVIDESRLVLPAPGGRGAGTRILAFELVTHVEHETAEDALVIYCGDRERHVIHRRHLPHELPPREFLALLAPHLRDAWRKRAARN